MKKKKKMRKSSNTIASSKPFRRARTKIKKPKFLSLSAASAKLQTHPNNNNNKTQPGSFPGHPDDDPPELSMADHMFAEAEGPTTLTGLLNGVVSSSATTTTTTSGVSYAEAHEYDSAARSLVRTAMRREREEGGGGGGGEEEEKWVSISEVVVETAEEEVTSGGGLWLKLDYEGVLNAWTRKEKGGPFCGVGAEEEDQEELPQTVPDMDQYGVVSGTPFWGVRNKEHWSVPENNFNVQHSGNYSQTGGSTGEEGWKIGIREASVLRYKEKRRNRLFAKRIRYEVRKLNAEKRPRIKGRFVRRGGD